MFVQANFVDIYLQGMRDRKMRSRTELALEIQLTDYPGYQRFFLMRGGQKWRPKAAGTA